MLSTARPTPLRFAGFITMALGGLLLGLGALQQWAVLGFPGDVAGNLDVTTNGVDVWEGKLALAAGVLILIGMIVMRLAPIERRRTLAAGVVVLGLAGVAAAAEAWIRSGARFGGTGVIEKIARSLIPELHRPLSVIIAKLQAEFGSQLRVDIRPGLYLAIAGGVLGIAGGILSLAWARRQALPTDAPPATDDAAPADA